VHRSSIDPRLQTLAKTFRGQIIAPGNPLYATVRVPFNTDFAAVHPLAVARPVDAADVARVVRWAAHEGVHIVVRSGGHSYGGYSTTTGVVVDLAHLSEISVTSGRATIGPGARLGTVYATLDAHGVAIPAGTCPSVGIGGHALGGGFGLASRAWGLACDNVLSMQIVTADGAVVTADSSHHADLYWACRGGGGGNFGIITRFVFRTHPVSAGAYFVASWPWSQVDQVVASFLEWAPGRPDALGSICRLAAGPGGPTVQVFGQYLGSESALQAELASLTPAASHLTVAPAVWLDLVRRWAGCLGHNLPGCAAPVNQPFYGSSSYLRIVPNAQLVHRFGAVVAARGAKSGALLIDAYGGAVSRIAPAATAFVHRNAIASVQYFAAGSDSSAKAWVESSRASLVPAMDGEAYVNYCDPSLPNFLHAYYGANLARLQQVKKKYDSHNLFHFPQSVR
jgi:hypothetical protein